LPYLSFDEPYSFSFLRQRIEFICTTAESGTGSQGILFFIKILRTEKARDRVHVQKAEGEK
jgi:hypothetical protein